MTLLHQAAQKAVEAPTNALAEMTARKDFAYEERNKVVAALAKVFPSGIARTAIEGWSEDWHGCVYIDLPTGQVSWHFHDSQAHLFDGLPPYTKPWDGHDTPEKYRRLSALQQQPEPVAPEIDRDTDGELLIDWSPSPGRMVTLSLRADGRLSYAFTWDGEQSHGTAQMPALQHQEEPREPVAPHTALLEQALSAMAEVQEQADSGSPDGTLIPDSDWRAFVDAHAELSMLWTAWRDSPGWEPLDDTTAAVPLGVLERGEGGAFRVHANMDALRAIYAMPPGEHMLYASPSTTRQQEAPSEQTVAAMKAILFSGRVVDTFMIHDLYRAALAAAPSTPEKAGGVPARTYLHASRVDALIAVMEGECDGLAVTRETAEAILHYLDGNAPPVGVAPCSLCASHDLCKQHGCAGKALERERAARGVPAVAPVRLMEGPPRDFGQAQDRYGEHMDRPAPAAPSPIPHPLPAQANDGGEHG